MKQEFIIFVFVVVSCCRPGFAEFDPSSMREVPTSVRNASVPHPAVVDNVTTTVLHAPPIPVQPVQGNWSVVDPTTGIRCIVVSMIAAVIVPYHTLENTTKNATLNVPANASARGTCGGRDQHIELSWNYATAGAPTSNNSLIFLFNRRQKTTASVSDGKFVLSGTILRVYQNPVNFPGGLNTTRLDAVALNISLHETSIGRSHICRPEEKIPMKMDSVMNSTAYLILSNVQLEAFRTGANETFSEAENCEPEGMLTSDVIPIAVGASLGVVFVGALIAYLVSGRRHMRPADYTSV